MLRRTPLKPGKGMTQRPPRPDRSDEFASWKPRPREAACRIDDGKARMTVPVPKFKYVRDHRLRDMCRAMPCMGCGVSKGSDWAHSNQAVHGKGRSIKASDVYVAALCWPCHVAIDQGKEFSQAERVRRWDEAHRRTVQLAVAEGLWPRGIPVPGLPYINETEMS